MKVAVVGTCASGKSSIVAALRERGLDAYSVAQEHSAISRLWDHLHPDRLVYLSISLDTLRARRDDDSWPEWIYQTQLERLSSAREHAHLVISTDSTTIDQVADAISSELLLT